MLGFIFLRRSNYIPSWSLIRTSVLERYGYMPTTVTIKGFILHFYPTTDPCPAVPPLRELPGLSLLTLLSLLKHPNCPLVPSLSLFKIALISGSSACSLVLASASVLSSSTKYILDCISEAFSVV